MFNHKVINFVSDWRGLQESYASENTDVYEAAPRPESADLKEFVGEAPTKSNKTTSLILLTSDSRI